MFSSIVKFKELLKHMIKFIVYPALSNNFLKTSLNTIRKAMCQKEIDTINFLKLVKEKSQLVPLRFHK